MAKEDEHKCVGNKAKQHQSPGVSFRASLKSEAIFLASPPPHPELGRILQPLGSSLSNSPPSGRGPASTFFPPASTFFQPAGWTPPKSLVGIAAQEGVNVEAAGTEKAFIC